MQIAIIQVTEGSQITWEGWTNLGLVMAPNWYINFTQFLNEFETLVSILTRLLTWLQNSAIRSRVLSTLSVCVPLKENVQEGLGEEEGGPYLPAGGSGTHTSGMTQRVDRWICSHAFVQQRILFFSALLCCFVNWDDKLPDMMQCWIWRPKKGAWQVGVRQRLTHQLFP